jgi:hypothetical protein
MQISAATQALVCPTIRAGQGRVESCEDWQCCTFLLGIGTCDLNSKLLLVQGVDPNQLPRQLQRSIRASMAEILPRCKADDNNQGAHHPRTVNKIPNPGYSSKAMDVAFYKTVMDVHATDMAPHLTRHKFDSYAAG